MRFGAGLLSFTLVLAAVAFALASAPAVPQDQSKVIYQRTGSEGTLTGIISFDGKRPQPRLIDVSSDPVCQSDDGLYTEDVIVKAGKLANVFVYVRSGDAINLYAFEAPASDVSITHRGCRVTPHVIGMQLPQTLKIANDDATTHNNHFNPKVNAEWNQSQGAGSAPLEKKFAEPEVLIPLRCNQHPWEKAYVAVLPHPFFAVSGLNGAYKISGLPPGQYTVVAWHERFGEQTAEVSVGVAERKKLDFTFSQSDTPAKP